MKYFIFTFLLFEEKYDQKWCWSPFEYRILKDFLSKNLKQNTNLIWTNFKKFLTLQYFISKNWPSEM